MLYYQAQMVCIFSYITYAFRTSEYVQNGDYYEKRFYMVSALTVAAALSLGTAVYAAENDASDSSDQKLKVMASFYPMYDFAVKVGGDKVEVTSMVPAGTEPHDWEPAAADIKNLEDADVFIYNGAGMEHWTEDGVPLLKAFTIFMGVFLQAVPFLILGVLLSSAIQIYVSEKWISGIFSKKTVSAMLCGILAEFFLPVCACASIPVLKSLVKKGGPLPAAICFMTASPVINPVVILSTYYAYNGSIKAVLCRCITGMICSFLIGISFVMKKPENYFKVDTEMGSFCTCGCYVSGNASGGREEKFWQFCIHARTEFYTVAKYLLAGIGISTVFQMLNLTKAGTIGNKWMPVSVLVMMLLAFLLSLCSSSDAVVARSITGITNSIPALGFLAF